MRFFFVDTWCSPIWSATRTRFNFSCSVMSFPPTFASQISQTCMCHLHRRAISRMNPGPRLLASSYHKTEAHFRRLSIFRDQAYAHRGDRGRLLRRACLYLLCCAILESQYSYHRPPQAAIDSSSNIVVHRHFSLCRLGCLHTSKV